MQIQPYFMENEEWYYFDEEEFCYKLTDKSSKEARESYDDFYGETTQEGKEKK